MKRGQDQPLRVRGLVLASGCHYRTPRMELILTAGPAIPILADVIRHTILPATSRLIWPVRCAAFLDLRPFQQSSAAFLWKWPFDRRSCGRRQLNPRR